MAKDKYQMVICRTCVRDNPAEGPFANFENYSDFYQGKIKGGFFKKSADLHYQNCFTQCENFYCVQVSRNGEGFLLKKISTPEKIESLIDWVKDSKESGVFQLPSHLEEHLVDRVQVNQKYPKI